MTTVLFGPSALEYHENLPAVLLDELACCAEDRAPTQLRSAQVGEIEHCIPWLSKPYHIAVEHPNRRRNLKNVVCHVGRMPLEGDGLVRTSENVAVPQVELAYLQMARKKSLVELVLLGSRLCALFGVDSHTGKVVPREPLTTPGKLRECIARHNGEKGQKAAMRALRHVVARAASPQEIVLALMLTLPHWMGGYALPAPKLNGPVVLPFEDGHDGSSVEERPFARCRPSLLWPEKRLVATYGLPLYRQSRESLARKENERRLLERAGYRVVTVTDRQLRSTAEMDPVAKDLARRLSVRMRPQGKNYEASHRKLWEMLIAELP